MLWPGVLITLEVVEVVLWKGVSVRAQLAYYSNFCTHTLPLAHHLVPQMAGGAG